MTTGSSALELVACAQDDGVAGHTKNTWDVTLGDINITPGFAADCDTVNRRASDSIVASSTLVTACATPPAPFSALSRGSDLEMRLRVANGIRASSLCRLPVEIVFCVCTYFDLQTHVAFGSTAKWTDVWTSPYALRLTLQSRVEYGSVLWRYRPAILACDASYQVVDWLSLFAPTLTDLTLVCADSVYAFAHLTALTKLDLDHDFRDREAEFRAGVSCHTQLVHLTLRRGSAFSTLRVLDPLTRLTHLSLGTHGLELGDVSAISKMPHLTTLALPSVEDGAGLARIATLGLLKRLELEGLLCADIRQLHQCTSLTALDLSGCDVVSDLSPLSSLVLMRDLDLDKMSNVTTLEPLRHMEQLECLECMQCDITTFEPLAHLRMLMQLRATGCRRLCDIRALESLPALRHLELANCIVLGDLRPLANATALETLDLENCFLVADIRPLRRLTGLVALFLQGCDRIVDLWPLADLVKLEQLSIPELEPVDFAVFRKLRALEVPYYTEEANASAVMRADRDSERAYEKQPTHRHHSHALIFNECLSQHHCDWCRCHVGPAYRCDACDYDLCVKCDVRLRITSRTTSPPPSSSTVVHIPLSSAAPESVHPEFARILRDSVLPDIRHRFHD